MEMILAKGVPTLQHMRSKCYPHPDNIFCNSSMTSMVIQCDVDSRAHPTKTDHFLIVMILELPPSRKNQTETNSVCKSSLKTAKRPQPDQTKTGKDQTSSPVFWFLRIKDCKKTGLHGPVWTGEFILLTFPYKMSCPRSLKTVKIWLRNKLNHTMLTKIVDFTEYYYRIFNF